MRQTFFIFLLSISLINAQPQKLTLKESVDLGLKNSKDIRISLSKLKSADSKVTEATAYLLPQIRLNAGYSRLSNIPPFEVTLPLSPVPIRISEVILNQYNLRLSFQQPLFTGFKLSSTKTAASLIRDASDAELQKDRNEAAFKIAAAFWNYYKAQQLLHVLDENFVQQERHLRDTRNFLEEGLVSQNDLLKLEVQYSNTKLQQIEAMNNVDIARMLFNQVIGLQAEAPTEIDPESIAIISKEFVLQDILNEARQSRAELTAMQLKVQAAEAAKTAAGSLWYPQIYLLGNFYYSRPNQRIMPASDRFYDTWDVSVALTWDLWNWGLTSAQTTQAEQNRIQTETALSQLKDAVDIEVYQNYLTYQRLNEKISVSSVTLEQAKEHYRITNEKYNEQLVTSTDLIDAETLLIQAETNYTNSLVDYKLARARLEKSLGRKIY